MATAVSLQAADRVNFSDLPAPVQRAIEASGSRASVKEINRKTVDGQMVYDVEYEKDNAVNPHVRFSADGTVLRGNTTLRSGASALDPHLATATTATANAAVNISDALAKLENVPMAAREAILKQAQGRDVVDIDAENWNGQTVYEVEFRDSGINPQIHVASDGTLLKGEKKATSGAKALFMGTQLEETPSAVQQTVKRELSGKEITDIDKEIRTGRTVYEVEFRDGQGTRQIHVAEDGTVVKDDRVNR